MKKIISAILSVMLVTLCLTGLLTASVGAKAGKTITIEVTKDTVDGVDVYKDADGNIVEGTPYRMAVGAKDNAGHQLKVMGEPTYVTVNGEHGIHFDGCEGNNVQIPVTSEMYNTIAKGFTMELDCYYDEYTDSNPFSNLQAGGFGFEEDLATEAMEFYFRDKNDQYTVIRGPMELETRFKAVVVYNAEAKLLTMYIDGEKVDEAEVSGEFYLPNDQRAMYLAVGVDSDTTPGGAQPMMGTVFAANLYSTPLTREEIQNGTNAVPDLFSLGFVEGDTLYIDVVQEEETTEPTTEPATEPATEPETDPETDPETVPETVPETTEAATTADEVTDPAATTDADTGPIDKPVGCRSVAAGAVGLIAVLGIGALAVGKKKEH